MNLKATLIAPGIMKGENGIYYFNPQLIYNTLHKISSNDLLVNEETLIKNLANQALEADIDI